MLANNALLTDACLALRASFGAVNRERWANNLHHVTQRTLSHRLI